VREEPLSGGKIFEQQQSGSTPIAASALLCARALRALTAHIDEWRTGAGTRTAGRAARIAAGMRERAKTDMA